MADFPNEKYVNLRKHGDAEMIDFLASNPEFLPARLRLVFAHEFAAKDVGVDAVVEVNWGEHHETFVVEIKTSSQPLSINTASLQAERAAKLLKKRPMVFHPYLSEEALGQLQAREISGIDLCGNACILGSKFQIWRSGAPNRFRESKPLQNIYRGDSSIFARCFLLQHEFESLTALREFALTRHARTRGEEVEPLQLGTASKVVQTLVDEMIVVKSQDSLRLVDPRRLVDNFKNRYRHIPSQRLLGKVPLSRSEIWDALAQNQIRTGNRYVATGSSSAEHYGVLFGDSPLQVYVDDIRDVAEHLEFVEGRIFANIELIEDRKNLVYFDSRSEGTARWSSPLQTWLELSQGGSREQEAGREMMKDILQKGIF